MRVLQQELQQGQVRVQVVLQRVWFWEWSDSAEVSPWEWLEQPVVVLLVVLQPVDPVVPWV